ncbi:MAG: hypothetical protein M1817_003324 [Caeruleum heppii]|nr:MAG: hypothetical protein M1817_003324 [Caeruleum heppii]
MSQPNGVSPTSGTRTPFGHEMRKHFLFDNDYINLNHGSFGTYPVPLRSALREYQSRAEANPDQFIRYTYPRLLTESRIALAELLRALLDEVVLIPNATTGINIVLRNLRFQEGDKILYPWTTYGACTKTVEYICETTPAEGLQIEVKYPIEDDELVEKFRAAMRKTREDSQGKERVKVAMFDTVVSMPGVRVPFERLVQVCRDEGVLSLIDGAHGVGHVDLNLSKLDADFFVSNCHKWLLTPRACAVFHVPLRNQPLIRSTLPTSHGFIPRTQSLIPNPLPPSPKSPFEVSFEFTGTLDNSPYLCLPAALDFRDDVCGGEDAIRTYCTELARTGGALVATILGTEVLENPSKTLGNCFMTNIRLPLPTALLSSAADPQASTKITQHLARRMVDDGRTFIALCEHNGAVWARFSAMVYLDETDFKVGAEVLRGLCEELLQGEEVGSGGEGVRKVHGMVGGEVVEDVKVMVKGMTLEMDGPEKAE